MAMGFAKNQPVVVSGELFLTGNGQRFFYDISDPYRPRLLTQLDSPHHDGEAESHQVALQRRHDGTELTPLRIYDVTSDPGAITLVGQVETPDSE